MTWCAPRSPYLWLECRTAAGAASLQQNVPAPSYWESHGALLLLLPSRCLSPPTPALSEQPRVLLLCSLHSPLWLLLFSLLSPQMKLRAIQTPFFLFLLAVEHQMFLTEKGSHHMTEAFHRLHPRCSYSWLPTRWQSKLWLQQHHPALQATRFTLNIKLTSIFSDCAYCSTSCMTLPALILDTAWRAYVTMLFYSIIKKDCEIKTVLDKDNYSVIESTTIIIWRSANSNVCFFGHTLGQFSSNASCCWFASLCGPQTTFNYYSTETQKQQRCSQRPWDPFLFNATRSNSRLLVKVEATKWVTINDLLGGHMKNKYMNNFSEMRVKTLPIANTILLLYVCECPERWGQPMSSALLVFCSGPVQKHFYQTQWDKNKDDVVRFLSWAWDTRTITSTCSMKTTYVCMLIQQENSVQKATVMYQDVSNKQKTSVIWLQHRLSGNSLSVTELSLCLSLCVSHVSTIKSTIRTRLPARVATPGEAEQTFFAFLHSDGERLYTVLEKQHCRSGQCNASTLNEDELHKRRSAGMGQANITQLLFTWLNTIHCHTALFISHWWETGL